jgi:hypothetical protein
MPFVDRTRNSALSRDAKFLLDENYSNTVLTSKTETLSTPHAVKLPMCFVKVTPRFKNTKRFIRVYQQSVTTVGNNFHIFVPSKVGRKSREELL